MDALSPDAVAQINCSSLALVAQQAFIINATVKDNILFGAGITSQDPYDESRYQEAIRACSLTPDLEVLQGGDQTEIGDKGEAMVESW